MEPPVLERLRAHLTAAGIAFREVEHGPTPTSEEAARARGEPLSVGGKALVVKGDDGRFRLFVLPADRRFDAKAAARLLGFRKARFASAEELRELTGLVPGSVPPFGEPILPLPLYVDEGTATSERIAFNAGSLERSIVMSTPDYLRAARPQGVLSFAR